MAWRRSALVVGGTRGIGRAVAQRCAIAGSPTVLTGTDPGVAAHVAAGIESASDVLGLACDVSSRASVRALSDALTQRSIHVASLVVAAGIFFRSPVAQLAAEDWNRVIQINLTGTFAVIQAVLPHLEDEDASIVIISSQTALRGGTGVSAYAAAKAGQLGLMRALAGELAPRIRVNAICPGFVDTEMLRGPGDGQGVDTFERLQQLAEHTPLRRLQTVQSVADVTHFLVGPGARDITGQSIQVSGGLVLS
jgi:NAD(P)-dependent dehydrogenase (short-subunit alcohol dehydrogenase family)